MWTPAAALLWECWRLSRRGLGIAMIVATFLGWLLISIESPIGSIIVIAACAWVSQGWAIVLDRKFVFTRPVATWKLAVVPLAFVAIASAVTYLVPVVILGTALDVSIPLLPMAAVCATLSLVWVAFIWQTTDPLVLRVVALVFMVGWLWAFPALFKTVPRIATSSAAGVYAATAFTSAAALTMAVFGVARRRRGDDRPFDWLVSVRSATRTRPSLGRRVHVPCPVSSPAFAQLWFEFHTVGRRVAKGAGLILLAFVGATLAGRITEAFLVMWLWWGLALPALLTVLALLGLQRKPGHTRLDVFAAARPMSTAQLVALKVLAGSLVMYAAWALFATGLWIFQRWVAGPDTDVWPTIVDYFPLMELGFVEGPKSPRGVARAFVIVATLILATSLMAGAAAIKALFVLSAKRVMLGALAVMLYTVLIVTLVSLHLIADDLAGALYIGALTVAAVIGTSFVLWRGRTEGVFSTSGVAFIVAIGLAFAIAVWLYTGGKSVDDWVSGLLLGLMPVAAMALAPWSFSRLRHR